MEELGVIVVMDGHNLVLEENGTELNEIVIKIYIIIKLNRTVCL
jgi:hypothetical protein